MIDHEQWPIDCHRRGSCRSQAPVRSNLQLRSLDRLAGLPTVDGKLMWGRQRGSTDLKWMASLCSQDESFSGSHAKYTTFACGQPISSAAASTEVSQGIGTHLQWMASLCAKRGIGLPLAIRCFLLGNVKETKHRSLPQRERLTFLKNLGLPTVDGMCVQRNVSIQGVLCYRLTLSANE